MLVQSTHDIISTHGLTYHMCAEMLDYKLLLLSHVHVTAHSILLIKRKGVLCSITYQSLQTSSLQTASPFVIIAHSDS